MAKSPQAFRTIREVADWLGVAAHVLRFWESKFPQIRPVKRAGGRRYYRPSDMALVGGIKVLLHDQGMTIRGVQKLIRAEGVAHVSSLSPPIDDLQPAETIEGVLTAPEPAPRIAAETAPEPAETAEDTGPADQVAAEESAAETATAEEPETAAEAAEEPVQEPVPEPEPELEPQLDLGAAAAMPEAMDEPAPETAPAAEHAADTAEDAFDQLLALARQAADLPPEKQAALRPLAARLESLQARLAAAAET